MMIKERAILRRRAILIILISFIGCSLIPLSVFLNRDYGAQHLQVRKGVMDLSTWNPAVDKRIKLDGEWEFYWNQLLTSGDFKAVNPPKPMIWMTVPSPGTAVWSKGSLFRPLATPLTVWC